MVLLKFVLILLSIYMGFWLLWKIFGKAVMRALMKSVMKRAQADMDRQTQTYQRHAEEYSPFEDSVYVEDDVKVSIRRGNKPDPNKKPDIKDLSIETVEYEDLD
ncbi:MAG: hypothetical protein IPN95_04640 [Bacteroidetes bacterium]|nr:hypothetical protein [Bacteroidota bacterium]MBL0015383.1 hypothetical protein [Bacteroidota bacterium]MBP6640576.1 hypothetical protein [Bacteroidia bacterium]